MYCFVQVRVKIRATVYAITDIDNVKQEFTANLAVRARWKEPLLQGKITHMLSKCCLWFENIELNVVCWCMLSILNDT